MHNANSKLLYINILVILIFLIQNTNGANILLYIGGISSHSHQYGVEPLVNKLADRGHNVTILSPLSRTVNHTKVHYFCPSELKNYHNGFMVEFGIVGLKARAEEKFSVRLFKQPINYFEPCFIQNEAVVKSPEFKAWADQTTFDLIIIDNTCNEGAYSLVQKYNAKSILYTPIGTIYPYHYDLFGIPPESSWFPSWDNNYEGEMGLLDRIYNTYSTLRWHLSYKWDYLTKMEKLIRDEMVGTVEDESLFGKPLFDVVREKTNLILSSQHYSDQFGKSFPPFVVPVGGMHLEEASGKLEPELETFIRGGSDGFMYVSFGSIITISSIPPKLLEVFFETLQSFKNLRFLWKWEEKAPDNAPSNILFKQWFAQNELMGHPKIRGIIFQGGQVTNQQAIFHGVPLVVFPVNGDQDLNAKRIRHTKNGIDLEFYQLSTSILTNAITTILTDKKYAAKARHLSELTRDRPMRPLDTAVWWTEFVLRHDDHSQLKPVGFHQQWWKQRSLDVWASLTVSLAVIILFLFCVMRFSRTLFSRYRFRGTTAGSACTANKHKNL